MDNEEILSVFVEILKLLREREAKHKANTHPFMDKFGDHPERLDEARARKNECNEIYWIVHNAAVKVERNLRAKQ